MKKKGSRDPKDGEWHNTYLKVKRFSNNPNDPVLTAIQPGQTVFVSGEMEQNKFRAKDGTEKSELQVLAHHIAVIEEATETYSRPDDTDLPYSDNLPGVDVPF